MQKEYGIKFDGDMFSIYHGGPFRTVYHAWPRFQVVKRVQSTGQWRSANKGEIELDTGLVGQFTIFKKMLGEYAGNESALNYFTLVRILPEKNGHYYAWDDQDRIPLTECYASHWESVKAACAGFINTIPYEVRKEAGAFRHGYMGSQWFLLKHCNLYSPFFDLMRDNPALAFSFAHRRVMGLKNRRIGRKETERLLAGPQRKIAAFIGLEDANAVVHILKKIPASACNTCRMSGFLEMLARREYWKTLLHLDSISETVISLYGLLQWSPAGFIPGKPFVEDVAKNFPPQESIYSLEGDIAVEFTRPLYRIFEHCSDEPLQFQSLADMRTKYARLNDQLNKERLPARDRKYPHPPFQGSEFIVPIATRKDLHEEGLLQRNCIYSYDADILAGRRYAYRVLGPERATLCLSKVRPGWGGKKAEWRIEEIKTAANQRPDPVTVLSADEWFKNAGAKS